jgi:selenocysteine lyase/cysteine desulfurase
VRPSSIQPPAVRFETGTPSFEGQAGVLGTIEYLEWLGTELGDQGKSRRSRLCTAMTACEAYERRLGERLLAGLATIEGLKLWGLPTMEGRVPTFSFTMQGRTPDEIASCLAAKGIFAWSGNFYAVEAIARLELEESGGLLRVGLCHYSTAAEVDRLLEALREIAAA